MLKNFLLKKSLVGGIIVILCFSSFGVSMGSISEETNQMEIEFTEIREESEDVVVTCSTFGLPGKPSCERTIPLCEAEMLYDTIQELQLELARDPLSDTTHQLQKEIITLAKHHHLIQTDLSTDEIMLRLNPIRSKQISNQPFPSPSGTASELFCNFASTGSGSALPIIIFPRLIPILLTPIPRLFVRWSTFEGVTSCGGLRSGKGFIATGTQRGTALGFWGIGFSIFLPPIKVYGLLGYALYASVNAENITDWPPNYPPQITILSPPNGAENVPISTSELTFQLQDFNGALMNYTVTTTPDVGSGSGSSVPDGTYSVPISGLEGTEEYTWHVQVDDGVNHVDVTSSFTTEAVAPVVSDPNPKDGKNFVPVDLSQISFYLSDPQGDLMDYMVETSPDIGSGSGTGVGEGAYSISVGGLENLIDYTWYVNVTDGTNWKHKRFRFQTEPMMVFDPFDEGWQYRKKITINHTQVAGDLTNFPVLVSTIDTDLRDKAQTDGDDILFMDDSGAATRLFHEIENYDGSSGSLVAWINVTTLVSDQNTTLYMYYGNGECVSQQFLEKVWDDNYCGVWHLDDLLDSTNNSNDGTNYGTDDCTGKIGNAKDFIRSNGDYINLGDMAKPANSKITTATFEIWVNPENIEEGNKLISKINSGDYEPDKLSYGLSIGHTGYIGLSLYSGTWSSQGNKMYFITDDSVAVVECWQHISVAADLSAKKANIYYNGEEINNTRTIIGIPPSYFYNVNYPEELGRVVWESATCRYDGAMDEVRISKVCRSTDWISTEYNNQNDPSSFLSFGPEETSL
jgi:hypothetical protein